MPGGFLRGASADQDTRFSNKQAKLLKSQKFGPELENPVNMRKLKMDVIRLWIANRVTEFLRLEDEVLINYIYGLLEAKEVNGKEVQISLTPILENNTRRFMKELWTLLLSAQNNESGVPQQFLDAKEEEIRKKQNHEIQEKERIKANIAAENPNSKLVRNGSIGDRGEEKHKSRRRYKSSSRRRSPYLVRHKLHSPYRRRSPSPIRRRSPSPVRRH